MVIFISDEAETFAGIQHFFLIEKIGYFTFYGAQYINLVKVWGHSTFSSNGRNFVTSHFMVAST